MKLHEIIIMILVVSMVVMGATTYMASLGDGYSKTVDTTGLNNTLVRLEEQNNLSISLRGNIDDTVLDDSSVSTFTAPYRLIKTAWISIKIMFGSWKTTETMIIETTSGLEENSGISLPNWFVGTLITMIVILLVAMLIYAFFKWRIET